MRPAAASGTLALPSTGDIRVDTNSGGPSLYLDQEVLRVAHDVARDYAQAQQGSRAKTVQLLTTALQDLDCSTLADLREVDCDCLREHLDAPLADMLLDYTSARPDTGATTSPAKPLQAPRRPPDHVYTGCCLTFDECKGTGFLQCHELRALHGRDVFL